MTAAPDFLIERTFPGEPAPGPAGSDVLSDALRVFRVTGAALLRGEFTAPWAWEAPPASAIAQMLHPGATRVMLLHIVAEGSCWIEAEGFPRRLLPEGAVVGFPLGHAHRMGAGSEARSIPVASLFPPAPWTELPVLRHGANGALTRLVCVYLRYDELLFDPVFSALPAVLAVAPREELATQWIEASTRYIVAEASAGRPGSASVVSRLTELLFIEILRAHIASLRGGASGWFAALADRHLARALAALHARPAHAWSIAELARQVGLSRSALVQRFHGVLQTSPMRYLAQWRLQLAAQALQSSDRAIAQVAADVGYGSEEAFSRAFKRATGQAPAGWRRARRGALILASTDGSMS